MDTISIVFKVTSELFIIAFVGFIAFFLKILTRKTSIELGNFTINITLPFLIFTSMIKKFPDIKDTAWYILPFLNILLISGSLFITWLFLKIYEPKMGEKELYLITSFQNGAFLPLAVVGALFPEEVSKVYYVYIFLFVLFFSPLIITTSRLLFSGKVPTILNILKSILNPAFISVMVSMAAIYTNFYKYIPDFIINTFAKIGDTTIPLILFTLGGSLYYAYKTKVKIPFSYAIWGAMIKLVILPGIVFLILLFVDIPKIIKIILILEAGAATAVNSSTFAMVYGGNYAIISKASVIVYILALFIYPFFISLGISNFK